MTGKELAQLASRLADRRWRLENLYHIVNEHGQDVLFKLRMAQADFIQSFHTYNIVLKARQLGFTTLIDLLGLDMAIFTPNFRFVVIAETKDKAADIFNNKIVYPYNHLPVEIRNWCGVKSFSASGKMEFANGSVIEVMVSARSGTCQFLHVSEYGPVCAKQPAKAEEIKTGSLPAVHPGGFVFIESTAMGNEGDFYNMVKQAESDKLCGRRLTAQEYKLHFYPWHSNPEYAVDESAIVVPDRLLKYFDELYSKYGIELSEEQMAWYTIQERTYKEKMWREFPSYPGEAFKVAQDGAYYGRQFENIHRENRITCVPWETALPVYTSWDLGMSDDTAIWFVQFFGKEVRVIDYYEQSGEGLGHYASVLGGKPYRYGGHFAPHDIEVRELGSGISRREMALKLGLNFTTVPTNRDLFGGIEAVRDLLPFCYFSEQHCETGLKCLENYKKAWDDKHGCYKDQPLHDWTSHGADAFRTIAVARKLGMVDRPAMPTKINAVGGLKRI